MSWRGLAPPRRVMAFVAEAWHETTADEFDDETREVRVHWPPHDPLRHLILDASRYRPVEPAGVPGPRG
ncbi:MAG TPA: hypothetical protein VGP96_00030 [Candidatus Dormibacteraeota bacterium]|nr:hypothetical protein [Candidatus Dormibacteraeota bacterium]